MEIDCHLLRIESDDGLDSPLGQGVSRGDGFEGAVIMLIDDANGRTARLGPVVLIHGDGKLISANPAAEPVILCLCDERGIIPGVLHSDGHRDIVLLLEVGLSGGGPKGNRRGGVGLGYGHGDLRGGRIGLAHAGGVAEDQLGGAGGTAVVFSNRECHPTAIDPGADPVRIVFDADTGLIARRSVHDGEREGAG